MRSFRVAISLALACALSQSLVAQGFSLDPGPGQAGLAAKASGQAVVETYLIAMGIDGSFGDSAYWGVGAMCSWLQPGLPFLFGELCYLYMGSPPDGFEGVQGVGGSAMLYFPTLIDDGTYLGIDLGVHAYYVAWSDVEVYDGWTGYDTHSGSSLDAQARIGGRFLTLGSMDGVFARTSITAHGIVGYASSVDVWGPRNSTDRTTDILAEGPQFGFAVGVELAGFACGLRLTIGYYRGFLMEFTSALGWSWLAG
jgi:hypothetical protein